MECPEELSEPEGGAFSNLETFAKSEPFAVQFSVFHDAFRELFFSNSARCTDSLARRRHFADFASLKETLQTFGDAQVSFELVSYSVGL